MNDPGFTTAQVWLDGSMAAATTSPTSATFSTPVPMGWNQQAELALVYDADQRVRTLSPQVLTFGPVIDSQACWSLNPFGADSQTFTVTGKHLTDFTTPRANISRTGQTAIDPIQVVATATATTLAFKVPTIAPITNNLQAAGDLIFVNGLDNNQVAWYNFPTEKAGDGSVQAVTFGATISNVNPNRVHLGGEDLVTYTGCGFDFFNQTYLKLKIGATAQTYNYISRSYTEAVFRSPNQGQTALSCAANPAADLTVSDPDQGPLNVVSGQNIAIGANVVSFTPNFGPLAGGNFITVTGSHFQYFGNGNGTKFTAAAGETGYVFRVVGGNALAAQTNCTESGDNTLVCAVPTGLPHTTAPRASASTSFQFGPTNTNTGTSCTQVSTGYTWSPKCTGIVPTYGWVSGVTTVTISGSGWLDVNITNADVAVAFKTGTPAILAPDYYGSFVSRTDSQVVVKTPPRLGRGGGNRKFGQTATIELYFAQSLATNDTHIGIQCQSGVLPNIPTFLYGPFITSINPVKGPIGPFNSGNGPQTPVTLTGAGFDEFTGELLGIEFGDWHQHSTNISSDTSNAFTTTWADAGHYAARASGKSLSKTDQNVNAYFRPCNETAQAAGTNASVIQWGPVVSDFSPKWGYHPNNAQTLTVTGLGFSEFPTGQTWCVFGTESVAATVLGDTQITCASPITNLAVFGSAERVWVTFGGSCTTSSPDYMRSIEVGDIHWAPRITGVNPTFGPVSGNTDVTITGDGFANGWNSSLRVYFAGWKSVGTPSIITGTVRAKTPSVTTVGAQNDGRNGWGLQHIFIELDGREDWRINSGSTQFYFGPVCSAVTGGTGGVNQTITVGGFGFEDIFTFFTNTTTVSLTGLAGQQNLLTNTPANTNTQIVFKLNNSPATCNTQYPIVLSFFNMVGALEGSVECAAKLPWGPQWVKSNNSVVSQCGEVTPSTLTTDFHGWTNSLLTLTGSDFQNADWYTADSDITYGVTASSTASGGAIASSSTTNVVFKLPAPSVNVTSTAIKTGTITFKGYNGASNCILTGIGLMYGPKFTSISPTVVKADGAESFTVTGGPFTNAACWPTSVYNVTFSGGRTQTGTAAATALTFTSVPAMTTSSPTCTVGANLAFTVKAPSFSAVDTRTTLQDGSSAPLSYGPWPTGVSPTAASLITNQAFTIVGLAMNDNFFPGATSSRACAFTSPSYAGNPTIMVNSTSASPTGLVCKTPDWATRTVRDDCPYAGTVSAVYYPTGAAPWTCSRAQSFVYGPILTSVASTGNIPGTNIHLSHTAGGATITVDGANFDAWVGTGNAYCLFGDHTAAPVTVAATRVICKTPVGGFEEGNAAVSVLFNPWKLSLANAWHWTPYASALSNSAFDGDRPWVTRTANGGGFCAYDYHAGHLSTSVYEFVNFGTSNYEYEFIPRAWAGSFTTLSVDFCDNTKNCSCWYGSDNTKDTISYAVTITAPSTGLGTVATATTVQVTGGTVNTGPTGGNTTNATTGVTVSTGVTATAGNNTTATGTTGTPTSGGTSSTGDSGESGAATFSVMSFTTLLVVALALLF